MDIKNRCSVNSSEYIFMLMELNLMTQVTLFLNSNGSSSYFLLLCPHFNWVSESFTAGNKAKDQFSFFLWGFSFFSFFPQFCARNHKDKTFLESGWGVSLPSRKIEWLIWHSSCIYLQQVNSDALWRQKLVLENKIFTWRLYCEVHEQGGL